MHPLIIHHRRGIFKHSAAYISVKQADGGIFVLIISAKLNKRQLVLLTLSLGAAAILIIMLVSVYRAGTAIPGYSGVDTAADRLTFIRSFGWEIDLESEQRDTVIIPEIFDEVYEKYNEIQVAQGLDLRYLVGREVERYCYAVQNHPSGEKNVAITLLIYKGKVVAGDVASPRLDGFMHGFNMP